MALEFGSFNGTAKKSEVTYMKLVDGPNNVFRILPKSLLPSYQYWVKGANGKEFPFEALQFDRSTEKFINTIPCPVKDLNIKDPKDPSKDLRCSWSYKCLVINKATGKIEVLALKKGIIEDIKSVSGQLGIDPTDPETGTWFTVERKKTGSQVFNVEYKVAQLKCKSEPLSPQEMELIGTAKSIDDMFPLETYQEQMDRLQKHLSSVPSDNTSGSDSEAIDELN